LLSLLNGADLNYFAQGSQLYWAFPFSR